MHFKHPEILYALLLLIIPIIVHLFQLRRFEKVAFTNVEFLKKISLKTRKSSQIKKWLTLLTRLLLLSGIIFAFSQPYTSNISNYKTKKEIVIYLDNSFSMQAKGNSGSLLRRAVQDLIKNLDGGEIVSIITNDKDFRDVPLNAIKNELIKLEYSSNQLDYHAAYLKAINCFSKDTRSLKYLIFISDFQNKNKSLNIESSPDFNTTLVQLQPVNTNNVSVDSLFIDNKNTTNLELKVALKNQGPSIQDQSVSLYNDENLIAKSSVNISDNAEIRFTIGKEDVINGKIEIKDAQLQFDNIIYFNIDKPEKINVLTINGSDDNFLKKIYTQSEFNYAGTSLNNLDYNILPSQNLVILNELKSIPSSLQTALKTYIEANGNILIIPSIEATLSSYNHLFNNLSSFKYDPLINVERRIFKINFSHPLFKDVFTNSISNFQYPKVNNFYPLFSNNASKIMEYEDGKPFLSGSSKLYVFTAPLNNSNSNFQNSSLIVPTLYNIGKQSLQLSKLYYTIGKKNKIDINTSLNQDHVLTLENNLIKIIPEQRSYKNKVSVITNETPGVAGHYRLNNGSEIVGNISYNYDRSESILNYLNLENMENIQVSNSIPSVLSKIKSNTKINELWKWFIIFALIMLIIEMLILKFYR